MHGPFRWRIPRNCIFSQVSDAFRRFDVDKSGKLDPKEFRYMPHGRKVTRTTTLRFLSKRLELNKTAYFFPYTTGLGSGFRGLGLSLGFSFVMEPRIPKACVDHLHGQMTPPATLFSSTCHISDKGGFGDILLAI